MNVRKNTRRGYWEVYFRYPDPDNPTRNLTFRKKSPIQTRRAAEKWGREMLAIYSDPVKLRAELAPKPTLTEFITSLERTTWRSLGEQTLTSYRSNWERQIKPALGKVKLCDLDEPTLLEWRSKLLGEGGYSTGYINLLVSRLLSWLGTAKEWGLIDDVPSVSRLKQVEETWTEMGDDEVEALVSVADLDDPTHQLCLFAINTGLRSGEIRALRWQDVDLDERKVTVSKSARANGKLGPTKNKLVRTLPLNAMAHEVLTRQRPNSQLAGELVWPKRGKPYSPRDLLDAIKQLCRDAGIEEVTFHTLRHTFASRLARKGVSMRILQALLGHKSIKSTERYTHLCPARFNVEVSLLDMEGKPASDCAELAPG